MRAVLQRVRRGSVAVDGEVTGEISRGLVVLIGVAPEDTDADADWLARKTVDLRIFDDDEGRMNLSLADIEGGALVVSQFTLLADCRKGRRPSFTGAAPPEVGDALYRRYADAIAGAGVDVATGRFGERMLVEIENDGPVTILLDSAVRPGSGKGARGGGAG
ncbi:MAG: D-tyrosyl-tRNA(Tyr) deacylase [Candidatus Eisenbacteria bacterium]|nr:D-tyrosyl-tRNA(Tyr) deacylase [Candidatus Eisenbacteria bacterium]